MNTAKQTIAVTGAFGYSGKYITRHLLSQGHNVITLTGNPGRPNLFGERIRVAPFNFDKPEQLRETLRGVDAFINTYWVRYEHGETTYHRAISNTRTLIRAASEAGVKRFVHVSITNPHPQSNLPYFWGKAILEEDIKSSGMSYALLRPTVIFGQEDILINNIAWFLRRLPVFGVPGDGKYKLQPIYVEDLAELAVKQALSRENATIDAIGPETFTFNELVQAIKKAVGSKALTVHLPPTLAYWATRLVGPFVGDRILTWEEVVGLLDNLLVTNSPPAGQTRLSDWMQANADTLGKRYANEITRHFEVTQTS